MEQKSEFKWSKTNHDMFKERASYLEFNEKLKPKDLKLEDGTALQIEDCILFMDRIWVTLRIKDDETA